MTMSYVLELLNPRDLVELVTAVDTVWPALDLVGWSAVGSHII